MAGVGQKAVAWCHLAEAGGVSRACVESGGLLAVTRSQRCHSAREGSGAIGLPSEGGRSLGWLRSC